MYIDTIFGMRWRIPTAGESALVLLGIAVIILILIFIKLLMTKDEVVEHEQQYLLFKAKQKGLTNFQYKILSGMIRILKLKEPAEIFSSPALFDQSIGQFINYIQTKKEDKPESLVHIMKDIVITYEKLYLNAEVRKPLDSIDSLESGHFIFFYTDTNRIFLGQLAVQKDKYLILKIFRTPGEIGNFPEKEIVHCFLWRSGDAEYTFDSVFAGVSKEKYIYLIKPEKLVRGAEVRLPYVSILVPCNLSDTSDIEHRRHAGTIIRLAEHEVVFQSSHELNSSGDWSIEFALDGFSVHSKGTILSEKNVNDKKILYITFKFSDLSPAANAVIKNYLVEHLPG